MLLSLLLKPTDAEDVKSSLISDKTKLIQYQSVKGDDDETTFEKETVVATVQA
jgi:hypothetical protein